MTICSSLYTKYTSAEQTIIEYFSMTIKSYMMDRVSTETLKYSSNDYYVCKIQLSICKIQFVKKQILSLQKKTSFQLQLAIESCKSTIESCNIF